MAPISVNKIDSSPAPRIGYLLRMYPRFSQTFVVNEILELEQQGVELAIASLRTPNEGVFHESVTKVKASADYLADKFDGGAKKQLRTHWNSFRGHPTGYRKALGFVRQHKGVGWFELIQAAEVIRWARKRRIRHVHVHFGTDEATVAMFAHLLGDLSYSLTLHAFDIFRDNVDRPLLAAKINASRFTVTVCESNRRFMIENLPGVNPDKIRVSYNGIDLNHFKAPETPRDKMTIFSVGRLIEKKGFADLISAVEILRKAGLEVSCEIAGEGRERSALSAQIKKSGLKGHVRLVGPLRQHEVRERIQRASCFALPCIQAKDGNVDALPTVLLESLACGCPTVSTRLSGIPEIINDGVSGLLVEPGHPQELADAIRRILEDQTFADRLCAGGQARARERFDVRECVARIREWLCDAERLAGPRPIAKPEAKAKGPVLTPEAA